jgi:hypothetical protein
MDSYDLYQFFSELSPSPVEQVSIWALMSYFLIVVWICLIYFPLCFSDLSILFSALLTLSAERNHFDMLQSFSRSDTLVSLLALSYYSSPAGAIPLFIFSFSPNFEFKFAYLVVVRFSIRLWPSPFWVACFVILEFGFYLLILVSYHHSIWLIGPQTLLFSVQMCQFCLRRSQSLLVLLLL